MKLWHFGALFLITSLAANANGLLGSTFSFTIGATGAVNVTGSSPVGVYTVPAAVAYCIGPNFDGCSSSGLDSSLSVNDTSIAVSFVGSTLSSTGTFNVDLTGFSVPILGVSLDPSSTLLAQGTFGLASFDSSSIHLQGVSDGGFDGTNGPTYVFDVLTAAPEPSSIAFGLCGIAGMLVLWRRRRTA